MPDSGFHRLHFLYRGLPKDDDLPCACVFLTVRNAVQPHEGAMLREDLAGRRSCHTLDVRRLTQLANEYVPRLFGALHHEISI